MRKNFREKYRSSTDAGSFAFIQPFKAKNKHDIFHIIIRAAVGIKSQWPIQVIDEDITKTIPAAKGEAQLSGKLFRGYCGAGSEEEKQSRLKGV